MTKEDERTNKQNWIEEFYNYGVLQKFTQKQIEILNAHAPHFLYQYRYGGEKDLENIANGVIWASAVTRFNDPFDCDFNSKLMETYCDKVLEKYSSEKTKKIVSSFRKSIHELRVSTAASCFSEIGDSILMWSHYANKHKGICVCYDVEDLFELKKLLVPMWYRNEKVNPYKYTEDKKIAINERIKEVFVQKSLEWQYEREWRLIDFVDTREIEALQENKGKSIGTIFPKKVILGALVETELKTKIVRLAKEKRFIVTQMKMSDEEYRLYEEA